MADSYICGLSRSPTLDYYLTSREEEDQAQVTTLLANETGQRFVEPDGEAICLIIRHAPLRWLPRLRRGPRVLLMDDDLPLAWRSREVPFLYGLRTSWRYFSLRALLGRRDLTLWVSTPELQRRYPGARLVPPRWFGPAPVCAPDDCVRWGYHGTIVHHKEPIWLLPVVEQVQRRVPEAVFEIFGGRRVARLFAHVPRVEVIPPRPWPAYLDYVRQHPLAVGMAPLLPGPFNAARSHTKAFDILRVGAVGVFSAREPYTSALGDSGAVLLADDPRLWEDAVVRLLNDPAERAARFERSLQWLEGQRAQPGELQALLESV